jgi:hypothetical protein
MICNAKQGYQRVISALAKKILEIVAEFATIHMEFRRIAGGMEEGHAVE